MAEEKRGSNIFEGTMAHMTYVEVEEAAREGAIVLFPTGVIEEHGPHLPLAVDVYGSYLHSRAIQSELEKTGIKALIAPPFYWGVNVATGSFGGSFTSRQETVVSVLWDALASLKRWGYDRVFFINHHLDSGHVEAVEKAIRKARQEIGIRAYLLMDQLIARRLGYKENEPHFIFHASPFPPGPPPPYLDIHAEGYETGFMLHYCPELVNAEVLKGLKPTNLTLQDLQVWRKGWSDARRVTPEGYFGDPAKADPDKGKKDIEDYGKAAAKAIEEFLGHPTLVKE